MQLMREVPLQPNMQVELEDRAAPRFTLLIRTAKLLIEDRQYLCVVRDISATGASIRSFHELPAGKRIALEFQGGDVHPVEPVWQKSGEIGFKFLVPIDVAAIVEGYSSYPKRDLRFETELDVFLFSGGHRIAAKLVNLSRQGGSILCSTKLSIAQPLRMEARGMPEIEARIRWRKDGAYGLVFDTTFSLTSLALLIHNLHAASNSTRPNAKETGKTPIAPSSAAQN